MKYYNYEKETVIDLEQDGCELENWKKLSGEKVFTRHNEGFFIFLKPENITASDEYADDDPYSVEKNIDGEFHKARMEQTLKLIDTISIDKSSTILDLGCGEGHITKIIKERYPEVEVSGLDYSISAIKYANKNFNEIDFIVADAYAPPYSQEYFDVVVCNNLWEHVPDPLLLLSRISKILKPRGYVIISTPSRYRFRNLIRVFIGKPVVFMSQIHVTEYTVGQVHEQLAYGGFDVSEITSEKLNVTGFLPTILYKLMSIIIKLINSKHRLEPTVFYLARKH